MDFDVELNALLEDLDGCRDKLSEGEKNWFKIGTLLAANLRSRDP